MHLFLLPQPPLPVQSVFDPHPQYPPRPAGMVTQTGPPPGHVEQSWHPWPSAPHAVSSVPTAQVVPLQQPPLQGDAGSAQLVPHLPPTQA